MKKLVSLIMIMLLSLVLTGCDLDLDEPVLSRYCVDVDDFEFYEATTEALVGDGKEWRLVTAHGDVKLDDDVYEEASTFEYERICYKTDGDTYIVYDYAADATTQPEPIIEYVEVEVEVEVPVYTHSIIDEDFIAEDGMFYYYIGEDIANLVYKQGLEMFTMNILYEKNLISKDQVMIHSITYFDGVYQGHLIHEGDWKDAEYELLDETILEFNNIEEFLQFMILNYSFSEVKNDWVAMTDEDLTTMPEGIWAEEEAGE